MARTIRNIVKSALNESEMQIMELMKLHGAANKVPFAKVKKRMQDVLEK